MENRQYESFDRGLTSSYRAERHKDKPQYYNETGGLVIWHIDQGIVDARGTTADDPLLGNTVNTVDHRPGVMPVYPENTEYRDGQALYTRPFFNANACETFGMEGNVVPLLQYDGCNTPAERVDSGIVLSVGDAVADVMSVTVDLPERTSRAAATRRARTSARSPDRAWKCRDRSPQAPSSPWRSRP